MKTTTRRKTVRTPKAKATKAKAPRRGDVLQQTWTDARKAITAAESRLEKRIDVLLKARPSKEAQALVKDIRSRIEKETTRAERELAKRVKDAQKRFDQERRSLGKMADDTVRTTLGALNIPTRQEVTALTRRVEELSRKIDNLKVRQQRSGPKAA